MLHPLEVVTAIGNELCRIKPIAALSGDQPLPGATPLNPYIDQLKLVPLLQTLEVGNKHIVETVELGPNK